ILNPHVNIGWFSAPKYRGPRSDQYRGVRCAADTTAHALVVVAFNCGRSGWRLRHGGFAVLNCDKIPGPNQRISLLSAPREADSNLSFSTTGSADRTSRHC